MSEAITYCSAHLERRNVKVAAYKLGLCLDCFRGKDCFNTDKKSLDVTHVGLTAGQIRADERSANRRRRRKARPKRVWLRKRSAIEEFLTTAAICNEAEQVRQYTENA